MSATRPGEQVELVTGAGGFAGGNLVNHLLAKGRRVRAMVRRQDQVATLPPGAEPVVADLCDLDALRRAVRGASRVYHVAALFRQAGLPDRAYEDVNVQGVRNLLDVSIEAGVQRVVHCSTVGVLGDISAAPANEDAPYNPGDIYQRTKMEGELVALDYFRSGRIPGVVIRPAMIYGPGDLRTLKLFRMIAAGRFFYIGPGNALVHFVDVGDLAAAFDLAMQHTERSGEIYIAAGRDAVPLNVFANFCADYLGVRPPSLHLPVRPMQWLGSLCETACTPLRIPPPIYRRRVDFYTKNRSFDGNKAARELGFAVNTPFQQEAIEIMDWYWQHGMLAASVHAPADSFMLRDLGGTIAGWNQASRSRYGFDCGEALGAVSHELLRTEFPQSLDSINSELRTNASWSGHLLHTTRSGKKIEVESHWAMRRSSDNAALRVLEVNRDVDGPTRTRFADKLSALGLGLIDMLDSATGLSLAFGV